MNFINSVWNLCPYIRNIFYVCFLETQFVNVFLRDFGVLNLHIPIELTHTHWLSFLQYYYKFEIFLRTAPRETGCCYSLTFVCVFHRFRIWIPSQKIAILNEGLIYFFISTRQIKTWSYCSWNVKLCVVFILFIFA